MDPGAAGEASGAVGFDFGATIPDIASGGVGGGILMALVGSVRQMMAK